MKGYSVGLQMEMSRYVDRRIEQIFKSIFGITENYPGSSKQKAKWLRFSLLNQLLKRLAYGDSKIVYVEKYNIIDALLFLLVTHLMDKLDDCKE